MGEHADYLRDMEFDNALSRLGHPHTCGVDCDLCLAEYFDKIDEDNGKDE